MKVRKGDTTVLVIAGKDKGAQGQGAAGVIRTANRVIGRGAVNRIKKHTPVFGPTQRGARVGRHLSPRKPRSTSPT